LHRGSSFGLLIELRECSFEKSSHLVEDASKLAWGRGLAKTLGSCRVLGHESLLEESEVASKVELSICASLEDLGESVILTALLARDLGPAIGIAQLPEGSGLTAVNALGCVGSGDQVQSRLKKSLEVGELERTEAVHHVNRNLLRFPILSEFDQVRGTSL
jgi:hypothetical protein